MGSSMSVGIDVNRLDTMFPDDRAPISPTDTGTPDMSGLAGSSPRSCR
jgi:hypothetical protein